MRTVSATTKDTAYIEPNSLLEKYTWLIARPTTQVHILGAEGVAKGGRPKRKGKRFDENRRAIFFYSSKGRKPEVLV